MNNKIPCEMIRDLLPLYADGLTGDVTNEAVREHLAEAPCRHTPERSEDHTPTRTKE